MGEPSDEDEWWRQVEADELRAKERFAAFRRAVKERMRSKGAFEVDSQFERQAGKIIIHKSTRPGIAYQVTQIDNRGPVGHADAKSLDDAILRAWDDVHPREKAKYAQAQQTLSDLF